MKKKIILIVLAIVVVLLTALATVAFLSQQPITQEQAVKHLKTYFEKQAKSNDHFSGIQVQISSSSYGPNGLDAAFANGVIQHLKQDPSAALTVETPFHAASVGKLFASTSLLMAVEEGKLSLDDPISTFLDPAVTRGLFVVDGKDYTEDVTVRHLINHTSGVADYFSGNHPADWQFGMGTNTPSATAPESAGTLTSDQPKKPFGDLILSEPDALWTPIRLLNYTRDFQKAVGKPGETYHYSDTGYILLGLILEKVENKPYHVILEDRFFKPLKMDHTWLTFYGRPLSGDPMPLADIWFMKSEVSTYKSLSVDWSGGGVVTTLDDLIKFQKAYRQGQLIDTAQFKAVFEPAHPFQPGIYYGLGGMEIHFEEFFFLLKDLPKVQGHIGILSTHLFYDPETDTHIAMNFGSDAKMEDSFKALIEILMTLKRVQQ